MKRLSLCLGMLMTLTLLIFLTGCEGDDTVHSSQVGATGGTPAYTLALSPSSRSVGQGQSATYTVTLTAQNGFNSPVALSVSGLPSGTAASFSSVSVTPTTQGATSTLTIATSGTGKGRLSGTLHTSRVATPTGTYDFTLSGSGGGVSRQATGKITIAPEVTPMFTLGVAPASNTVTAGLSSAYTVTLTSENGFNSPVALTLGGLPNGASAAFNPATVTPTAQGATSTLTVQTAASTPAATSTLSITGTGGGKTNQASATLVVNAGSGGGGGLPNILVADTTNGRVAGLNDMTGAGWKTLAVEGFSNLLDVATDTQGRIYMVERNNSRITRVNDLSGAGKVTFGSLGSGVNQFAEVQCVFVDGNGRIYIGDTGNHRVIRINDMTGAGWVAFNLPKLGSGTSAAEDIYVDKNGKIFIADGLNRILRMDDMTGAGLVSYGSYGSGVGQFSGSLTGICTDSQGRIYATEYHRIVRIDDMTGAGWTTYGVEADTPGVGKFSAISALALDANNRIYVMDNGHITRMDDMTGTGWTTFGSMGDGVGQFGISIGLAVKH